MAVEDHAICGAVARHAAIWFVLRMVGKFLLRRVGPAAFQSLSGPKQLKSVLYLLSSSAAVIATSFSVLQDGRPTIIKRTLLDSFLGYLVHDTLTILPHWRQYKSELGHHVAVLALCGYVRARFHTLFAFGAPIMRLEISTLFLNIMWMLRQFPSIATQFPAIASAVQPLFLLSFLWVRVLWLPYYVLDVQRNRPEELREFGQIGQADRAGWSTVLLVLSLSTGVSAGR